MKTRSHWGHFAGCLPQVFFWAIVFWVTLFQLFSFVSFFLCKFRPVGSLYLLLLLFFFSGPHPQYMEVPSLGVKLELQLPACTTVTATSVTYTTVHGNTRSLTHWLRPGIEPTTSWFLVGLVCTVPLQQWFNSCLWKHFVFKLGADFMDFFFNGCLPGFLSFYSDITAPAS